MTALAIFVWVALIAVCAFLLLLDWIDTAAEAHARRSLAVDEWLDEASEEINLAARDDWDREVVGLNEPPRRIATFVHLDFVRPENSTVQHIDMSDLDQLPTTDRSA